MSEKRHPESEKPFEEYAAEAVRRARIMLGYKHGEDVPTDAIKRHYDLGNDIAAAARAVRNAEEARISCWRYY